MLSGEATDLRSGPNDTIQALSAGDLRKLCANYCVEGKALVQFFALIYQELREEDRYLYDREIISLYEL